MQRYAKCIRIVKRWKQAPVQTWRLSLGMFGVMKIPSCCCQVVIMDMKGLSFWPDPRAIAVFKEFLTVSQKLSRFASAKFMCILYHHGMTNLISTHKTEAEWLNQFCFCNRQIILQFFPLFFRPSWTTFSRKYYPETLALLSCTKCIGSICGNASVPFSGRKGRGVWISKDFFTLLWGDNSFPCATCTIQCFNLVM